MTPTAAEMIASAMIQAFNDRFAALERRVSNLEQQMRDIIMHALPDKDKGETP